ncbi:MAG: hypothetical protein J0I41_09955 [Filimonas sp.]|nr:hypothetical protein [Filimonas sp.]
MKIDLADGSFTIEKLRKLVVFEDDIGNIQFRVTNDGYLFLSHSVGNQSLNGILFRFKTNSVGCGCVRIDASKNDN